MPRIGIILGSTRPNRNGEQVARWVFDIASRRVDAEFELVDLRDYPLPHLDEPMPPSLGQYANDHTKEWAQKIVSFDGFVIVTTQRFIYKGGRTLAHGLEKPEDFFVYEDGVRLAAGKLHLLFQFRADGQAEIFGSLLTKLRV